jgi:hypothetical protein
MAEENAMILIADDHGCKPNGRFLERVTIAAGSVVLIDTDRKLRAIDVGKSIAIPGAVDLVASIAELEVRKDVANASMTAGNNTLMAVFPPLEQGSGPTSIWASASPSPAPGPVARPLSATLCR